MLDAEWEVLKNLFTKANENLENLPKDTEVFMSLLRTVVPVGSVNTYRYRITNDTITMFDPTGNIKDVPILKKTQKSYEEGLNLLRKVIVAHSLVDGL